MASLVDLSLVECEGEETSGGVVLPRTQNRRRGRHRETFEISARFEMRNDLIKPLRGAASFSVCRKRLGFRDDANYSQANPIS